MKPIFRRLQKLEKRFPPARESAGLSGQAAAEHLAELLAEKGIVRGPNESLAEALARALGISSLELRGRLLRGSLAAE